MDPLASFTQADHPTAKGWVSLTRHAYGPSCPEPPCGIRSGAATAWMPQERPQTFPDSMVLQNEFSSAVLFDGHHVTAPRK